MVVIGPVDVGLALLAIGYGIAGYRTGLVVTALSLVGFVGGALLGLAVVPRVITAVGAGDLSVLTRAILVVGGIGLVAIAVQALVGVLTARLARAVRGHGGARRVDGVLGALAAAVVTLALAWGVASAVRPIVPASWSRALASSRLLGGVDAVAPMTASELFTRWRADLPAGGFPQVFGGLAAEPIAPVTPPDPAVRHTPGLDRAQASVVRVVADAPSCGRVDTGSGWVVAPGRVVTNAHVVAGSRAVTVSSGGTGQRRTASVVAFDPQLDLAVLSVPGLPVAALPVAADLRAGDPAVVAGFPLGGGYTLGSARVRQVLVAAGKDVYGIGQVQRRVYSLFATVRPGNSGGPVLDAEGRVVGTVFARSLDDARTGYALTTAQTRSAIAAGAASSTAVGTGACTPG